MNNRVNILAAFNNANYDTADASLLGLIDFIRCFHYPNRGENPRSSIAGVEGDPVYVQVPFWFETSRTFPPSTPVGTDWRQAVLQKVSVSVVAIKSGSDDFVVETFSINVPTCQFGNQQAANFQQTRNYISYLNDPYNSVSLATAPAYDVGTKKAFIFQYGLVLRYDYWNSILTANVGGATCNTDINNDIAQVNNSWSNLASEGWSLVFRFNAEVTGHDGTTTQFQAQTTINCKPSASLPTAGPAYACEIYYYTEEAILLPNVLSGGKSRIRMKFTPNGTAVPDPYDSYWGTIFGDLLNGGPTDRRFASTEYASEDGSPFSDPGDIQGDVMFDAQGNQSLDSNGEAILVANPPTEEFCNGNVRGAVYSDGTVVLETIYDDEVTGWGQKTGSIIMSPRLGFKVTDVMQDAAGNDILDSQLQQIIS